MKNKPKKILWKKGLSMEEWGEERQKMEGIGNPDVCRIGASDVSVCTGSNKWKCPQRLFYHLTGYYSSFFVTETTLAGHLMEPITIGRWESYVANNEQQSLENSLHGIKVRKMQKANYFLVNPLYPNSFVSLDYTPKGQQFSPFTGELYEPLTPVELKHTNRNYYIKWTDGCALQYLEQIQYQMLISNTKVALLLVLIDGVNFKVKEIEANPEQQQYILSKVNEFAEKVKVGKMALQGMKDAEASGNMEEYEAFHSIFEQVTPEPLGTFSSSGCDNVNLMQELYADAIDEDGSVKEGDEQDELWMNGYLKCIRVNNSIEEVKNVYKTKLLKSCGEFEGIKAGERKMTNRRATTLKKAYFGIK